MNFISDFGKFLITSQNFRKFIFLKFWPAWLASEINGGKCVKLSSRCIVKTPLEVSDIGKVSPRIYCDFTLTRTSGDDGYFSNSILNSFPEVPKRVEFLNKFYQCLLYGQLPHKAEKLVVCGTNNSGKSSWARIFFGLMNR